MNAFSRARVVAATLLLAALVSVVAGPAPAAAPARTVNSWACRPPAAHPVPVILVHGTFGNSTAVFGSLSSALLKAGYCVFALDYGAHGTDRVAESAAELKTFVEKVLKASRAKKVSFVGHSQGGMMPRYYIKYLGGAAKVDDMIGMSPDNHGTTWASLSSVSRLIPGVAGVLCLSCFDQLTGSAFLRALNRGDESPGAVSYTNIVSKSDTIVQPYTSGYLASASNVANIRIQNICPSDVTSHFYVPLDPAFIRMALNALAHAGPASTAYRPKCTA